MVGCNAAAASDKPRSQIRWARTGTDSQVLALTNGKEMRQARKRNKNRHSMAVVRSSRIFPPPVSSLPEGRTCCGPARPFSLPRLGLSPRTRRQRLYAGYNGPTTSDGDASSRLRMVSSALVRPGRGFWSAVAKKLSIKRSVSRLAS